MNDAEKGGWMIAAGCAVYLVIGLVSWQTDAQISFITIGGSLLLIIGSQFVRRAHNAPKTLSYAVTGIIVASFIAGRVANGMKPTDLAGFQNAIVVGGVQAALLTLAGGVALSYRGSTVVRVVCAVALAGNIAATLLMRAALTDVAAGTMSLSAVKTLGTSLVFVDNLLLVAAVIFAVQQRSIAPAPIPNPFATPPRAPQAEQPRTP